MSTKKFLDLDGLSHVKLLLDNMFSAKVDKAYKTGSSSEFKVLSDNNYTDAEVTKLSGIASGAQVNVVETVQVNGAALTPASKTVNVQIPITSVKVNGTALTPSSNAVDVTVPTKTSDLTNDGNGSSPFATEAYVGTNGGKIDVIQVNGATQTITNKTVNITVPTNNNQLTNGAGYQTASDVTTAIDARISSTYKPKGSCTFANKPSLSSSHEGEVWNITDAFTTTADFVEGASKSYPAGTNIVVINTSTTSTAVWKYDVLAGFVDLSSYLTDSDVIALTNAEIDSVFE